MRQSTLGGSLPISMMEFEQEPNAGGITIAYIDGNGHLKSFGPGPLEGSNSATLLGRSKSFIKLDNEIKCHDKRFWVVFENSDNFLNGFVCGIDRLYTMGGNHYIYVTLESGFILFSYF